MLDILSSTVKPNMVVSFVIVPGIGLAVIAATIILPAVGMLAVSKILADSNDLLAIALLIAEPLALAAAVVVTFLFARMRQRFLPGFGWSLLVGWVSSTAVFAAATRANDVDLWTLTAVVLLPIVAFCSSRREVVRPECENPPCGKSGPVMGSE